MKRNVFLFLLFALAFSCTKFGKNVTIKGKVLNPITGEGIPNVEIWLQKSTLELPGGLKTIKTATTDANGNYELNKFSLRAHSAICALSGDYYPIGWRDSNTGEKMGSPTLNVKKGKTMHADFHTVPYGEIQINIKNQSCFDSNDELKLYFDGGLYDGYTFNPGLMTTLTGCIDIPGTPVKSTMGNKYFHWEVTKNGVTNTYYDTVFVQDTGITTLDIFY
jgi:hypothetical protein